MVAIAVMRNRSAAEIGIIYINRDGMSGKPSGSRKYFWISSRRIKLSMSTALMKMMFPREQKTYGMSFALYRRE